MEDFEEGRNPLRVTQGPDAALRKHEVLVTGGMDS